MQANKLLHFPDLAGGDMNPEQRADALLRMVNLHRPLAALVIFLGVVALEDFIRDLGARLADTQGLNTHFPKINDLLPIPIKQPRPFARPDRDPAPLSDWLAVNDLYEKALGIRPFPEVDLPKLHDLAILRHTVAHHAALIREIDVPRFKFWSIQANSLINPPVEFVQDISQFLYQVGRTIENAVTDRVLQVVIAGERPGWFERPSELLVALIETFNWFGALPKEEPGDVVPAFGTPDYKEQVKAASDVRRDRLNRHCLTLLRLKYGT